MYVRSKLSRSKPEEQGIYSSHILSFLDTALKNNLELHSFMLVRHGYVVSEKWWPPYDSQSLHTLYSLSKSFTSTAVGFAISEGLISLDDPVLSFFSHSDAPKNISENLSSMEIQHLLTMSTGHANDTNKTIVNSEDGNWVKSFLNVPVDYEPGSVFVYNSGATYMLSAILQKVTGQTLLEYLRSRLFEPLDITDAVWDTCPRGINTGGWGLYLNTEGIAKFGQLYLQNGIYNGEYILPHNWAKEAISRHISTAGSAGSDWEQGYGYQFWRCRHGAYRGDGAFGQFCVVMPNQDAVVVITSKVDSMQSVLNLIWDYLLPAMK